MKEFGLAVCGGLVATLAFPIVFQFGADPALDALPREVLILPAAMVLYRICLIPGISTRRRFAYGFTFAFTHFATLLHWLLVAMMVFGKMPLWQAFPALFLLAGVCAVFVAGVPLLVVAVGPANPISFAAAVVVSEFLRANLLTGFPWGLWGYSQARNTALLQLASIGGVYLVTAAIAVVAALGYQGLVEKRVRRAVAAVLIATALFAAGSLRLHGTEDDGEPIVVAILQGNIEQEIKNRSSAHRHEIRKIYSDLTEQARASDPDLILWPEAAWPVSVASASSRIAGVPLGVATVLGAPARGIDELGGWRAHNSAFLIDAEGRVTGRQDKMHLVPFGEYVPMRWLLPVEKVVPGMVDMTPGEHATPLGDFALGIQICFDGIFPELGRAHAGAGAKVLVNLTNDGWYGLSSGPYQHLDFYPFRAVETGRWVARATNTGISALIDHRGRVRKRSELGERTVLAGTVELQSQDPPYVMLGDSFVLLAFLTLFFLRFGLEL